MPHEARVTHWLVEDARTTPFEQIFLFLAKWIAGQDENGSVGKVVAEADEGRDIVARAFPSPDVRKSQIEHDRINRNLM